MERLEAKKNEISLHLVALGIGLMDSRNLVFVELPHFLLGSCLCGQGGQARHKKAGSLGPPQVSI